MSGRTEGGAVPQRLHHTVGFSRNGTHQRHSAFQMPRSLRKARYVAPLWPAGHLPRKGGDQLAAEISPISKLAGSARAEMKADLPP